MKILAVDTSGVQAGAAILAASGFNAENYILAGEIFLNARTGEKSWTHSEILMPGVAQLFELTRISPEEIDFVAYTSGPGSFTGLRIGAACALGLSRALGKPAIAVPTLDALAYNMYGAGVEAVIIPMLDARRGQVYTAVYYRDANGTLERKTDFLALSVSELGCEGTFEFVKDDIIIRNKACFFLGDGADANKSAILQAFPPAKVVSAQNNRQRTASVALCAAEKIRAGHDFTDKVEILYVRAPQAVREAAKREAHG